MPRRFLVKDIAFQAGLSTATVDRVLNQRAGVRSGTVQRVLKAATELDYLPVEDLNKVMARKRLKRELVA